MLDIDPEMLHKQPSVPEPDVIVIDADEQKKIGYPCLEAGEGKQASSMLRRLATAGNGKRSRALSESTQADVLKLRYRKIGAVRNLNKVNGNDAELTPPKSDFILF